MIQVETLPSVDTLMDRQRLVGWIVRDGILDTGMTFTEAAVRWPISLPTLNRLMNGAVVGVRFLRTAEHNLRLPKGLLEMVLDGEVAKIAALKDLNEPLRTYILTELGGEPKPKRRTGHN